MLLGTYYAQNYAGIIGWCLTVTVLDELILVARSEWAAPIVVVHK